MAQSILKRSDIFYPELSYKIIGCAFDVYNALGSGHHEKYYQRALAQAFSTRELQYKQELSFPIEYQNKIIGRRFLDFVMEDKIVIEIKKGDKFSKTHIDQVLHYLKLSDLKLAILINFSSSGVTFKRIVNFNS